MYGAIARNLYCTQGGFVYEGIYRFPVGDGTIIQGSFQTDPEEYDVGVNFFGNGADVNVNRTYTAVPEPTTLALFGFGLAGFGLMRRRKAS
jgi:hypothetical protein